MVNNNYMDKLLNIFKSLGDKNRLRIIKMLQQRPLCVCEITAVLGLAVSTVSKHLSILKNTGIIKDKKSGKWVEYFLLNKFNNIYLNSILPLLLFWMNDDTQIKSDIIKLKDANREKLCK